MRAAFSESLSRFAIFCILKSLIKSKESIFAEIQLGGAVANSQGAEYKAISRQREESALQSTYCTVS